MIRGVAIFLMLGLSLPGIAMEQKPKSAGVPEVAAERSVSKAIALAGENGRELKLATEMVDSSEKREALLFLLRYMPERDLVSLDAKFLVDQVDQAFEARDAHAWAADVPTEIFYNDVLPYALLNEKREDWRSGFMKRFGPMVEDAKTLRDAVVIINKAIKDEVGVEYSTKREKADQSAGESMESGLASCTGLSILLCNALRSVGIPARIVGTPLWTTKRGNHNWVEFYDPVTRGWHFTEYYMDSKGIDHGWFVADASKGKAGDYLHAIYASSWKPTGRCFPLVWDMDINYVNAVDVTDRYVVYGKKAGVGIPEGMCELWVEFFDAAGDRKAVEAIVVEQNSNRGHAGPDLKKWEGVTPDDHADLNEFLVLRVPQDREYKVIFKEKGGDRYMDAFGLVETTGKKWLRVSGGKP